MPVPPAFSDHSHRWASNHSRLSLVAWARSAVALFFFALAGRGAVGVEVVGQASATPTTTASTEATLPMAETARSRARSFSEWVARGVDSWFGDIPFDDGGKVSNGKVTLGVFHRRDTGTDADLRFTARFHLPNVEKSAYLFVGREDSRDLIKDRPASAAGAQQLQVNRAEDRSFLGGLGATLGDNLNFRVGVSAHLQPFVQVRYDKPWQLSPNQVLAFRETLFWSRGERFGSTTALSYELQVQHKLALRWQGAATITQETRNVEWSSNVGAYRTFGDQQVLSLQFLLNGTGTQGNGVGLSDRGVLLKWEQPIYKDWLVGEVAAGHFWLRPDAQSRRGRAWALGTQLKMFF